MFMNFMIRRMLHRSIVPPQGRHTASLIFLHGSGDTGFGIQNWVKNCFSNIEDEQGFNFNHIKVIYPTAPPQPYTPMNGGISNVWFDRNKISYNSKEASESVADMKAKLTKVIQIEIDEGIPLNRIIVGGFSMGGSMSLHLGYRKYQELGGIFAMSSFLSPDSSVYDAIKEHTKTKSDISMPELFMAHCKKDQLVLYDWGADTFKMLQSLGVKGEFHPFEDYYHEIFPTELKMLRNWILEKLPETTNKL